MRLKLYERSTMFNKIKEKILFRIAPKIFVLEKYVGIIPRGMKTGHALGLCDMVIEDHSIRVSIDKSECQAIIGDAIRSKTEDSKVFVSDDPGHEDSVLIYNSDTKEAIWYNITTKVHR